MSDYFNFGFDDNSWKHYQQMVMKRFEEVEKLKESQQIKDRFKDKNLTNHPYLNFCLPHEFGGLGDPLDKRYSQINIFPQTEDLPVIKPRTNV